ncbi:MAG: hypothetical protein KAX49_03550 [Halanaerobiales bacterium]|nr:hypothetical protein [Halanaerobiales bacterium]
MVINLKEHFNNEVKVLSGREIGKKHRDKFNLNRLDKNNDTINIIVPDDLYSINTSYFLGLFGPSIRNLGEDQFRKKYIFQCDEVIRLNIEDGIELALKDSDVLE